MTALRSPGVEHRIVIVGATGSGKSVAGLYHLSRANFHEIPWTIIDSKEEASFKEIEYATPLPLDAPPPQLPGLYVIRPRPGYVEDEKPLEDYLRQVHSNGRHGLFIDEGYLVFPARSRGPLQAIFTQGRTRLTPIIFNTQRPANIGREAMTQASFFQVFDLTDMDERKLLRRYIPEQNVDVTQDIGLYRSVYHDVSRRDGHETKILNPVRPAEESVAVINRRLAEIIRQQHEVRQFVAEDPTPKVLRLVRV